jgi:hypothetical protein
MMLVEGGTRVTQSAQDLAAAPREVNRRMAATITDVVELATLRVHEELEISGNLDKASRIPVVEVSMLLDISRTMAGVYIDNGLQLRDRFHHTQTAFDAGDISFAHVREIITALQGLADDLLTALEPEAILIAQQGLSRSVLRSELDRIVIAADPDGAAERRQAAELDSRISAVMGTVCARDGTCRSGMRSRVVWTEERGSAATESTREDDTLRTACPRAPASK